MLKKHLSVCTFLFIIISVIFLSPFSFAQSKDRLIIESEPDGAQVYIDAVLKGTTPLIGPTLPAGDHMLVIYKEGYENYVTTLTQTKGTVHIKLKRHKGSLKVTTSPTGANVILDKTSRGTTPLSLKGIAIGKHSLQIEKAGYEKWEDQIEIHYQETLEIDAKLSTTDENSIEVSGSLLVISEPSQARVFLDGELKGESTPLSLPKITPGNHELEIIRDGYQIYHTIVTVGSGKSNMISAKLEKDIYWPMFRHDPRHSGYINTDLSSSLQLKWKYQTDAEINTGITVVGNSVIVASQDRFLYCLNMDNGAIKWKYEGGEVFSSTAAVSNNVVYVGNDDDYIHAVDLKSGQVKWKYLTGGDVSSSPIVIDNVVYVGSFDRYLYALNAQNGSVIWKYAFEREIWSSPAIFNHILYFGSIDGYVYAIDAKNASLRWKYKTGGAIKSSPAVHAGLVLIGSDDGYLYALDAYQGAVKWQFKTDGAVKSSPAVRGKHVVFGSDDNNVYCVDIETEKLVWQFSCASDVTSSPAITNEMVVVGSWDRKVYSIDINSGKELWSYTTGGSIASSPAIIGSRMFIGSRDGNVYVFEEK